MKYDDMTWHTEGDFPAGISPSAAAIHIGIFTIWAWKHGLGGDSFSEFADEISDILGKKELPPSEISIKFCDGKLTDEDLNEEGNEFASWYYEDDKTGYGDDYKKLLAGNLPSFYHVSDDWNSYAKMENRLNEVYKKWKIKFISGVQEGGA